MKIKTENVLRVIRFKKFCNSKGIGYCESDTDMCVLLARSYQDGRSYCRLETVGKLKGTRKAKPGEGCPVWVVPGVTPGVIVGLIKNPKL